MARGYVLASSLPELMAKLPPPQTPYVYSPGLYANAWYGLFAPAGTPKEIIARLHSEIMKLLESADMKERLAGLGVEPAPSTPDQLASLMRDDLVRWAKIVKDSGAKLD